MPISRKVTLGVSDKKTFFSKGREIARLADAGRKIPMEMTILFEDVEDFNKFISNKKISLLTLVRINPKSISELAKIINRNRSSVTRDINELESSGLVHTEMVDNPGHGKVRMVWPVAKKLLLQIQI